MSTENNQQEMDLDQVKIECDNYQLTIRALQAFLILITWDKTNVGIIQGSKYCIGRRMDRHNGTPVTPDVVIQRNTDFGYVVEVKNSLPQNKAHWEKEVAQVAKYDGDLIGWWPDTIQPNCTCIVVLVEYSRSAAFRQLVENLIANNQISFSRPISIIEFNKLSRVSEFLSLRRNWGVIEDGEIKSLLDEGWQISYEKLVSSQDYTNLMFYDTKPIVEHTMTVLWMHLFPEIRVKSAYYDEKSKAWPLSVTVEDLTKDLQKLFGAKGSKPRETPFPRNSWVKEALDEFVKMDLAKKGENNNEYVVYYQKLGNDFLERIHKLRQKSVKKKKQDGKEVIQLELLTYKELPSQETNQGNN